MSGLEVAGVVLSAIPLVIATLEHYSDGLSTIQRWRRYERERQSLVRNLDTERVKLQNVCEKLLVGLVPPSRIEAMIDDPLGKMWREEETHNKIRARLWKCFDVFEATVRDVQEAVDEMRQRIDSQRGGAVGEFKRAVFTLRRTQYTDLLLKIREGVSNLENFTDRNMELEPARMGRSYGKMLVLLQDMSKSLYRALKSSLGCMCKHEIGLRLESRKLKLIPADGGGKSMKDTEFKLALSYGNDTRNHPWPHSKQCSNWEEIRIRPRKTARTPLLSTENPVVLPPQPKKGKGKKTVSFSGHLEASTTTTATLTQPETRPSAMSIHTPIASLTMEMTSFGLSNVGATLDLCQRIKNAQKQAQCDYYGMIIDHSPPGTREYTVHPVSVSDFEHTHGLSVISLREILEQKGDFPHLPYRDRLQLAVIISSSVLQLQGSPWLPDILTSGEICFIKHQGHHHLAYDQPFIMKTPPGSQSGLGKGDTIVPSLGNPTLLSLGFLLVEVILGATLASLRTPQEALLAGKSPLADYITAQRVAREIRMTSSNYGTAVTRCMSGNWHEDGCLDTEDFCQDVYSGVVALLEKDLENS